MNRNDRSIRPLVVGILSALVAAVVTVLPLTQVVATLGSFQTQTGGIELEVTPTKLWDVSIARQTIAVRGTGGFSGSVTVSLSGGSGVQWRCDSECSPGLGSSSYVGTATNSYSFAVTNGQWTSFTPELINLSSPLPEESAATTSLTVTASASGVSSVSSSVTVRSEPSLAAADVNCSISGGTQPFSPSNKQTVTAGESASYTCAMQVGGFTGAWTSPTAVSLSVNESFSGGGVSTSFSPNPASISTGSTTSVTFTTSTSSSTAAGVYSYSFSMAGPDGYRTAFVPAILTVSAPAAASSSSDTSSDSASSPSTSSSSSSAPAATESTSSSGSSSTTESSSTDASTEASQSSSESTATTVSAKSSKVPKSQGKPEPAVVAEAQLPTGALGVPVASTKVSRTTVLSGVVSAGDGTPLIGALVRVGQQTARTGTAGGYYVSIREEADKVEELPKSITITVQHPLAGELSSSLEVAQSAGGVELDYSPTLERRPDATTLAVTDQNFEAGATVSGSITHFPASTTVHLFWAPQLDVLGPGDNDSLRLRYRASLAGNGADVQTDGSGSAPISLIAPATPGSYALVATADIEVSVPQNTPISRNLTFVPTERADVQVVTITTPQAKANQVNLLDQAATTLFGGSLDQLDGSERRQLGSLLAPVPRPLARQTPFGAPTVGRATSTLRLDGCEPPSCSIKTDPNEPVPAVPAWRVIPGASLVLRAIDKEGTTIDEQRYDSSASFAGPGVITERLRTYARTQLDAGNTVKVVLDHAISGGVYDLTTDVLDTDLYDRYLKPIFHVLYTIGDKVYDEADLNRERSAVYQQLYQAANSLQEGQVALDELVRDIFTGAPYRNEPVLAVTSDSGGESYDLDGNRIDTPFVPTTATVYTDVTETVSPWERDRRCAGTLGACAVLAKYKFAIQFLPTQTVTYLGFDTFGVIDLDYVDSVTGETRRATVDVALGYYREMGDPYGLKLVIDDHYRTLNSDATAAARAQIELASAVIRDSVSSGERLLAMGGLRQAFRDTPIAAGLEFAMTGWTDTSRDTGLLDRPASIVHVGLLNSLIGRARAADAPVATPQPTNYLRIAHTGLAANLLVTDPLGRSYGVSPLTGELVDQLTGASYRGAGTDKGELFVPGVLEGAYRFTLVSPTEGDVSIYVERAIGESQPETSVGTLHLAANQPSGGELAITLDTKPTGSVGVDLLRYLGMTVRWYWWLAVGLLGAGTLGVIFRHRLFEFAWARSINRGA